MRPGFSPRLPVAPRRILYAAVALLFAGSGAALAQEGCVGFLERTVSASGTNGAMSVFAADVDGDGDLDALSASFNDDRIAWHENTAGDGSAWTAHVISTAADGATSVFAVDLDGDGDTDVLSASANDDTIAWYENIGGDRPTFYRRVITRSAVQASSVWAEDMDGDGNIDVLASSFLDGTLAWYENLADDEDPDLSFAERVITSNWPGASAIATADVDNDGDPDVVAASYVIDSVAWYETEAGTEIGEDGVERDVLFFTEHVVTTAAEGAKSVFPRDLNGDQHPDLLVASSEDDTIAWYSNTAGDGSDWTERIISMTADGAASVRAAGEGDALVVLAASSAEDTVTLYVRDPESLSGFRVGATVEGVTSVDAVFAADIDEDGAVDALSASSVPGPISSDDRIAWYRNELGEGGGLAERRISGTAEGARSVFAEDIDGDGDADVVTGGGTATIGWYENGLAAGGAGWEFNVISTEDDGPSSVFVEEIDGAGGPDIVAAFDGADKVVWFRNDGAAEPSFTEHLIDADLPGASAVFAVDIDGDGDTDVVSASFDDDRIAWYENAAGDGSAWEPHAISTTADGSTSVAAADLDLDGDTDVVSASFHDDTIAWHENTLGDGSAWTVHEISTTVEGARAVAVADIDGDSDGYPDVLAASALGNEIMWFQNEADPEDPLVRVFTERGITGTAVGASAVAAHDLDEDGDTDLLATFAGSDLVAWYENDGEAPPAFTAHLVRSTGIQPRAVTAARFDAAAGPDLFVGFDFDAAWYESVGEICESFDASGDGRIDGTELAWLARAFGRTVIDPQADWWAPLDYNMDGIVDGADLAILTSTGVWGQTVTTDDAEGTCEYTCQ